MDTILEEMVAKVWNRFNPVGRFLCAVDRNSWLEEVWYHGGYDPWRRNNILLALATYLAQLKFLVTSSSNLDKHWYY